MVPFRLKKQASENVADITFKKIFELKNPKFKKLLELYHLLGFLKSKKSLRHKDVSANQW